MGTLLVASALQLILVAVATGNGQLRLAPGQWMPIGIAVAGVLCAGLAIVGTSA
jgi:hypothetical protein